MSDLPTLPPDDSDQETRRAAPTEYGQVPPVRRSVDSSWSQPGSPPPRSLPDDSRAMPPVNPGTQRMTPVVPPASGEGHVRQTSELARVSPKRKGKARERRDSGLYLPLWSLALMMLIVLGISFSIVVVVMMLGAQNAPASDEPVFVIVTAPATAFQSGSAQPTTVLATATIPPEFDQGIQGTLPPLALQGPTLPPVVFTPTPLTIAVGSTVRVNAIESGLNVRAEPGVNSTRLFVAADQSLWLVVDGPLQADSLTWWKIQNPDDPTEQGWGAGTYLEVVAP
ncbi:MAG: SH3 domain-containing protein [Anaerolineae bacterium]